MRTLFLVLLSTITFSFSFTQDASLDLSLPSCLLPPAALELEKGIGGTAIIQKWPKQIIPFEMYEDVASLRLKIITSIRKLNTNTNICIMPRGFDDANYVRIVRNPNNRISTASSIGYQGDREYYVRLSLLSQETTIIHEFQHILGMFHEHQRPDRDSFVRIVAENIEAEFAYAFDKLDLDSIYMTPYDYRSNMHYFPTAFSINGEATILHIDENTSLPTRIPLGEQDIETINTLYPLALNCDSLYDYNVINVGFRAYDNQNDYSYCTGIPLLLNGISNTGNSGENWSWQWDIPEGDPSTISGQNPEVVFHTPGVKTIRLTVKNHYMEKTYESTVFINNQEPRLEVRPNPVLNGQIRAIIGVTASNLRVRLTNSSGQIVQQRELFPQSCEEQVTFEVAYLPKGVYFLTVDDGKRQNSKSVILL